MVVESCALFTLLIHRKQSRRWLKEEGNGLKSHLTSYPWSLQAVFFLEGVFSIMLPHWAHYSFIESFGQPKDLTLALLKEK